MNNFGAIAGVVVIALLAGGVIWGLLASVSPRCQRRSWCMYAFGMGGAVVGGMLAVIADSRYAASALVASCFCAVLGTMVGNVVRLLSGPDRRIPDEDLR